VKHACGTSFFLRDFETRSSFFAHYRVHDDSHGLCFGLHERVLGEIVLAELADLVERHEFDVPGARGLGSAILGIDHVLGVDDELTR
jgi:hypothetical protein